MHFKVSSTICFNLDQSKMLSSGNGLKAFRDDKLNVAKMTIFLTMFSKGSFFRVVKSQDCVVNGQASINEDFYGTDLNPSQSGLYFSHAFLDPEILQFGQTKILWDIIMLVKNYCDGGLFQMLIQLIGGGSSRDHLLNILMNFSYSCSPIFSIYRSNAVSRRLN